MCMLTGARVGEVRTARFEQLNLDYVIWSKPAATTKQRKIHRVPISQEVVTIVRQRQMIVPNGNPWLFPGEAVGQPVREIRRFWAKVQKEADLPDVRIHDLRHTFASLLVSGGASLEMIGRLLGHSQMQTTQRYAHLMDSPLRAGVGTVASILRPRPRLVHDAAQDEVGHPLPRTPIMSNPKTNSEDYLRMYRQMVRIRTFEDNANQLYLSAKMPGLTHMYSGEEAVAVGICEALKITDKITSTHRGHGHCVAKGANLKEMFCELLGKEEGYCRGKGGSMHIADQSNGNLGANAIVGGSMGIATGAAFSAKLLGKDDVTVCFFGDGATAQGLMYEVMNMAALWHLPVIYACENNGYSEYTKTEEIAAGSITARAEAFGIEAHQVDGQDVLAVNALTTDLVARARKGEGPFFIELMTYRYHGHHVGDINREYYRTKAEEKDWKENRDPIIRFRAHLITEGLATEAEIEAMNAEITADAEAAVAYALNAKYPDVSEVDMHVFTDVKHALA